MSPGPAGPSARQSRALRWTMGVVLAIVLAIGLVLFFLLTQATGNQQLYERNYTQLFVLNVVVAVFLGAVIGWVAWRLIKRLREGRFGSRLLVKLAAVFALAGFAPGLLIYVVSYQFVSRSIESWFDVQVEGALDAGLNLGRATVEVLTNELTNKTRAAVNQLQDAPDVVAGLMLERLRDQLEVREAVLWNSSGQLLASAGDSHVQLSPDKPSSTQLRSARSQRIVTWVEGLEDGTPAAPGKARIKSLALVPRSGLEILDGPRYLMLTQVLPETLVANALAVTSANREYQERALARQGLRRMYIGTLTLSLFLAVFGAVLLAIVLGNQITRPMLLLADGVRQVAAGDLTPKAALQGRDELGGLTRSFADMTQQLADARKAVELSMDQVNAARENLQTILDNLTAGVIVLDHEGVIRSVNPGATRILRMPLAACEGKHLADIEGLEDFARHVKEQFDRFVEERTGHALDHWQESIELGPASGSPAAAAAAASPMGRGTLTLIARGAEMPGNTWLLVFDDISEIVSAQRAQAWGEVARRLAHEIKNPLTPIQLSAERLERKLSGKVGEPEQALVTKSVKTIVDQVDAMKRLVNEFRDYARLPSAELHTLDLNQLVAEVLQLYSGSAAPIPVKADIDDRCPPIQGDSQQLRQVLHNLIQNAQDATEMAGRSGPEFAVTVRTQWNESRARVRLSVIDWGSGFPEAILKRAFEPYVTTKAKGTGLGLAVVKKIADEHGARIDLANRHADEQVIGAQVSLSFAVGKPAAA